MLRISKLTDYGTVILACLAAQREQRLWTAAEVAERTQLGQATVSKLLKKLQRGGLVVSTRGSRGGYRLALPATDITAAHIVDALEGPFAITECSSEHSTCSIESNCRVGKAWQRVNVAIHHALSEISLAQLAGAERGPAAVAPVRLIRATNE